MDQQPASLKRQLSLASVVAFGLAYMAPSLVLVIFGVIALLSDGTAPTAFAIAALAIVFTALSYARMSKHFPLSGSAYFYARKLIGSRVGFLVGWAVLLDYLFLPMMAWLVQSIYLNAQFPSIPIWVWLIINASLTTGVNILGVSITDRVNKVLTLGAVFLVVLFAAYCLVFLVEHPPASYTDPFWNADSTALGISAAAAVAAYSYLGFDAVTTLSEETRDAKRTIPRAVVLIILFGGVLFAAVAYLMQLVHPGGDFENPDIAGYTLSIQVGGQFFADWTNLAAIVAGFASGLAVQLSSSRLLYFMGRDGVLPGRVFGFLDPRTKTPVYALLVTGAMVFLALFLDLGTATSFVNFGAFAGFTAVNICVIVFFYRHHGDHQTEYFSYLILPAIGACVTIYLLTQLSSTALLIGSAWLGLGVVYLLFLTRGLRRPVPEARISLDEYRESSGTEPDGVEPADR